MIFRAIIAALFGAVFAFFFVGFLSLMVFGFLSYFVFGACGPLPYVAILLTIAATIGSGYVCASAVLKESKLMELSKPRESPDWLKFRMTRLGPNTPNTTPTTDKTRET